MLITIFAAIMALVCVVAIFAAVGARRDDDGDTTIGGIVVAVIAGLICAGVLIGGSYNRVDARAVGIVTGPGGYNDTIGPGVEWLAPWKDVEGWSTRNQIIRFDGDGKGEERENYFTEPKVTTKLADQSEAYIDVTVTWKITEKSVEELWKQHKTFKDTRQDFVNAAILGSISAVFDGYNPLGGIDVAGADVAVVSNEEWSTRLTAKLGPNLASRFVDLVQAQVTYVDFDKVTKEKLQALANEKANTRLAQQKAKTAEEEAKATKARNDPTLVQPGCEALIRDLAAMDQLGKLPDGWQCPGFTGSIIVGGGDTRRE